MGGNGPDVKWLDQRVEHLAEASNVILDRLEAVEKMAQATQRKVYRDKAKTNGEDENQGDELPDPLASLRGLKPGDELPPDFRF